MLAFSSNVIILLCLLAAPGGHMSITSVNITGPVGNVIKVGQLITVLAGYSLGRHKHIVLLSYCLMIIDEDVNGGKVSINLRGLVVNIPLCDALSDIGLKCPLAKNLNGTFNIKHTMPHVLDVRT